MLSPAKRSRVIIDQTCFFDFVTSKTRPLSESVINVFPLGRRWADPWAPEHVNFTVLADPRAPVYVNYKVLANPWAPVRVN